MLNKVPLYLILPFFKSQSPNSGIIVHSSDSGYKKLLGFSKSSLIVKPAFLEKAVVVLQADEMMAA